MDNLQEAEPACILAEIAATSHAKIYNNSDVKGQDDFRLLVMAQEL